MKYHIFRKGEGLKDILERYHLSYDELKNNNPYLIERNLRVGDKLKIDSNKSVINRPNFKQDKPKEVICPHCNSKYYSN